MHKIILCACVVLLSVVLCDGLGLTNKLDAIHDRTIFTDNRFQGMPLEKRYVPKNEHNKRQTAEPIIDNGNLRAMFVCASLDPVAENDTLASGRFNICGDMIEHGSLNLTTIKNNYQHDVIFNPVHKEYFVVYIEESGTETSLMGMRLNSKGELIASFAIYEHGEDPSIKRRPAIAYNSQQDQYLIAFSATRKLDNGQFDEDVLGLATNHLGTVIDNSFFVGPSGYFKGRDANPQLAYNSNNNTFVVTFQHGTALVLQLLDGDGIPLSAPRVIFTAWVDEFPDIAYDPDRNTFLVAWQLRTTSSVYSDIVGAVFNATAFQTTGYFSIIGSMYSSTELLRDHDPRIEYSPVHKNYFCIFETWLAVNAPTHIIAVRVHPVTGEALNGFAIVDGADFNGRARNGYLSYFPQNDSFVIAYEAYFPPGGEDVNTIRAAQISADSSLTVHYDMEISLGTHTGEYFPAIAYNEEDAEALIIWNHGKLRPVDNIEEEEESKNSSRGNGGVIAGAVIASIAIAGCVFVGGFFVIRRLRKGRSFYGLREEDEVRSSEMDNK